MAHFKKFRPVELPSTTSAVATIEETSNPSREASACCQGTMEQEDTITRPELIKTHDQLLTASPLPVWTRSPWQSSLTYLELIAEMACVLRSISRVVGMESISINQTKAMWPTCQELTMASAPLLIPDSSLISSWKSYMVSTRSRRATAECLPLPTVTQLDMVSMATFKMAGTWMCRPPL
jgi:hypothetical protein